MYEHLIEQKKSDMAIMNARKQREMEYEAFVNLLKGDVYAETNYKYDTNDIFKDRNIIKLKPLSDGLNLNKYLNRNPKYIYGIPTEVMPKINIQVIRIVNIVVDGQNVIISNGDVFQLTGYGNRSSAVFEIPGTVIMANADTPQDVVIVGEYTDNGTFYFMVKTSSGQDIVDGYAEFEFYSTIHHMVDRRMLPINMNNINHIDSPFFQSMGAMGSININQFGTRKQGFIPGTTQFKMRNDSLLPHTHSFRILDNED